MSKYLKSMLVLMAVAIGATFLFTPSVMANSSQQTACVPNPFPGVDLYLKGTFSGWGAEAVYKFTYQCNKYELMTELKGAHEFKVADPNWTLASTFGAVKGASDADRSIKLDTPKTLVTGEMYPNLTFTGSGYYTVTLDVSQSITQPVFTITENKSCVANPFPNVPLYLKGTFSGWSADEQYKFTYRCNAFILGANLEGQHEFKVADADWTLNSTFGAAKEASDIEREIKLDTPKILVTGEMYPNLVFSGTGYYTFTLDVSQSFTQPTFTVNKNYACATNPFTRPLYLRGDFNGWGAEKAYLFSYKCNAFEVTANVKGKNGFKIADANWTNGTNFGVAADSNDSAAVVTINTPKLLSEGGSTKNLVFMGTAAHKFTLDIANSITQPTLTVGPETAPIGPTDLDRIVSVEDFLTNKTWQPLTNVVSYKQEGNTITFSLENTKTVKLYLLTPSMFRVRFNRAGNYTFEDSYAVIKTDFGAVDYKVTEQNGKIIVTTADLKIEVNKTPFAVSVYKGNVLINADTQGMALLDSRVINFKKLISGTKIYGLGEKTGSVKKNGTSLKMWNTDAYGYTEGSDPLYVSIPFFMETNKDYSSGTFFDNSYQTYFNMGQRKADEYYFGALNGELNYYFMSGNNVKDVLAQYTALTGRIPMPPRWALGYQQSRYSYKTEAEVNSVANTLRQKKMPADVIYLDIDFLEGNKAFTWNKTNYPDAPGMIARHQKQGFKFITIADPHMKIENGYAPYDTGIAGDHFLKNPDGTYAEGNVWPGLSHFPDFSRPETRVWWGTLYKPLVDLGIDAIWNDMNEPAVFSTLKTLPLDTVHYDFGQNSSHEKMHNVYGLQMANGTVDGLDKLRPNNRNFVLSRAGYAGLQRYAAVWTGDNTANWTHLKLNVTMGLGMGLSGLPIVGADVGGYSGRPTPELLARWMQLGAFFPLYRNHTETGDYVQEPWTFGIEVENISRKYMEMRYKHLQMLYDFTHQAHKTGAPISRPLFMEFPADENTYDINDEFLYGDAMLIAPVVVEGAITRNVYLPAGVKWYDYWTGQVYEGGQSYQVQAKLDTLPIFVKAGAIIPSQEVMQYVGEKATNPITLTVYPTVNYSYTLYLDDGTSKDYLTGKYREVTIAHTAEPNKQSLTFNVVTNGFTPTEKYYYVKLLQSDKPASVVVAGQTVRQANVTAMQASCDLSADVTAYCFNATEKTLVLKVMDSGKNFNIEVNGKAYHYLPVIKK